MSRQYLFTSESVTEGHPDKVCDQISDAVLDALLTADPASRVAAETAVSTGLVLLTGEITTRAQVDYTQLVRDKIRDIGYIHAENGFSADSCAVLIALGRQSPDIAQGVDQALEVRSEMDVDGDLDAVGAGDQGLMFGFACDETPELMPMPISIAHRLARQLAKVRKDGTLDYLRPDGKTQVTVVYEDQRPVALDTLLISTQHTPTIGSIVIEEAVQARIRSDLWEAVVQPALADLPTALIASKPRFLVNPTGKFVIGGPQGDAGLTGRKIIVDTYGGYARHGGGAFSGKDPTKVDRSAAYAARYVAKNIVAAGLARRCEVQVAYAIGKARPVSIMVETFGTATVPEERLQYLAETHFDLRPAAILRDFDLRALPGLYGGSFYQKTAAYGHLGRLDLELPWEKTDKALLLREACLTSALV
ncbi:methionine adenosyltransferase [Anthocerotibacter panamensis]|uniref:methionine adenosyltransferase n=1 Tax=Anthocerotibacter panamensis TaxID=2857077 RepID=UPI001C40486C|nr:methionine adenosyltransferase [Anthocerotibacter panamensis]